ncbi:MAG: class I SAM-dependent methyltransferase [Candidatus Woesebacteria bacterium]|nr:MAG: class I SAM-dependent methyltransferase [Candidatus Woesebacteria bacterium]
MVTTPYKKLGAYHWDWYAGAKQRYVRHVQFLSRYVREENTIDIGAGDGLISHVLTIKGVDNDPYAIKLAAEKGVKVDLGNATRLPYKIGQFDSALMSDTLEYISNFKKALSEARRVIKKYFYVSISSGGRFTQPGQRYHTWTPNDLVITVDNAGFRLVDGPIYKYDRQHYYFKFQKA